MSTSDEICTDSCKDSDDVCDMNDMLHMTTIDDNEVNSVSVCANCGKEDAKNICNKCKQVKYCNAVCKKVHKKKHKKDCEEFIRLATEKHNEELRIAAELHDKELFKQPPAAEDCPICFQRLPTLDSGWRYQTCCGKVICSGCVYAPVYDNQGNKVDNQKCPFCRIPTPYTDEEAVQREKKRVDLGDRIAIHNLGVCYSEGEYGYPQNHTKAIELWHQAAELGQTEAYTHIGYAYDYGQGVEVDKKKAIYYYELAAIGGDEAARYNLGLMEEDSGNIDRAIKHYMILLSLSEIQTKNYFQGDRNRCESVASKFGGHLMYDLSIPIFFVVAYVSSWIHFNKDSNGIKKA